MIPTVQDIENALIGKHYAHGGIYVPPLGVMARRVLCGLVVELGSFVVSLPSNVTCPECRREIVRIWGTQAGTRDGPGW